MRFLALATDYDGTLAHDGVVSRKTIEAMERLRASGRKVILVTGRDLRDLLAIFSRLDLLDLVVAENGALLYSPGDRKEQPLSDPPPEAFIEALRDRGVVPLDVGRIVVATWESQSPKVLDAIQSLGLELQVIFNKGSLMVLPSGVNKSTGLAIALNRLGLSPHNVVGVGDAENDHTFLGYCECGVAVANALPALKERADIVTTGSDGDGVVELIDQLMRDDLAGASNRLVRHDILLGWREDGAEVRFPSHGQNLLVAGASGSGKSALTGGFTERLLDAGYQVCVIDPEGDHGTLKDAVVLGSPQSAPTAEEVLTVLQKPERSVVLNLVGLRFEDRPAFFQNLLAHLRELRGRTGRPHWIIVDEAHHVLPLDREASPPAMLQGLVNTLFITVRPEHVSPAAVATAHTLVAFGKEPYAAAQSWSRAAGCLAAPADPEELQRGEALLWRKNESAPPTRFRIAHSRTEQVRHKRKYAAGELSLEDSFYFRGPESRLNLRAHNLITFLQIADGVDSDTWLHHLRQGDYSKWFRRAIHSDALAEEAEIIETEPGLSADRSRARIREAIERRFTLPA